MTKIAEISSRTALEIAFSYRQGETTPAELTEHLLGRIKDEWASNIFISMTAERARAEADAATRRYREGRPLSVLDGVPVAWKDLIDVAGVPTTAGSVLFNSGEAKVADAPCVAHAAAAGMVSVGKVNMTELAYSGLGLNPHFGTPVNPNDKSVHRSPGGSSSGSGAAVAAGLVPCSIGTDTGGSIRIPASFNGVFGLKTSEKRINKDRVVSLSTTLDTIGPLARSASDCAALDMVLRGAAAVEARRADITSLRFLIPTNVVFEEAEQAVIDNFENSVELLAAAGATIVRQNVDALDEIMEMTARHGSLVAAEAYFTYHDAVDSEAVSLMDRRVVYRMARGREMTAFDLLSIGAIRRRAITTMDAMLGDAFLIMPSTPVTAPEVAPLEADDALFHEVNLRILRNTMLGNNLRQCGMAIPNGRDHRGLPTSILVSAPHGEDTRLLGAALEIERVLQMQFRPTWRPS